jgi:hypothetical protein
MNDESLREAINSLRDQIEINNKLLLGDTSQKEPHNIWYFMRRYIQEVLEASAGLFVVKIILKKEFSLEDFLRIALVVGLITLIIEEYNKNYATELKGGIYFTLGSIAFSG